MFYKQKKSVANLQRIFCFLLWRDLARIFFTSQICHFFAMSLLQEGFREDFYLYIRSPSFRRDLGRILILYKRRHTLRLQFLYFCFCICQTICTQGDNSIKFYIVSKNDFCTADVLFLHFGKLFLSIICTLE